MEKNELDAIKEVHSLEKKKLSLHVSGWKSEFNSQGLLIWKTLTSTVAHWKQLLE